jgi:hypothetical protein
MGRPPQPPELVRRNRLVIMLRDDELAKLERLADEMDCPLGTAAYELVARGLKRAK